MKRKKEQVWEEEEGLEKARKYCAWQERCRSEVWTKLSQLGCPRADIERLLTQLEYESFLDEGRFARAYTRGHFSQKGWGKVKIREALRGKRIHEDAIADALELIEPDAYLAELGAIAHKKLTGDITDWETQQKLRAYLEGKGYEWDLIDVTIKEMVQASRSDQ